MCGWIACIAFMLLVCIRLSGVSSSFKKIVKRMIAMPPLPVRLASSFSPDSSSITNGTKTGRKISNGLLTSGPPWAARSSSNGIVATRVERVATGESAEGEPAAVTDAVPLDRLVGVAGAGRPEAAGWRQQARQRVLIHDD